MAFIRTLILLILLKESLIKAENDCPLNASNRLQFYFLNRLQNHIQPDDLSKTTCFSELNINFTMGTDRQLIKADGESPARTRWLSPFCMDTTAVSNSQCIQYVKETNYTTEVYFSFVFFFYYIKVGYICTTFFYVQISYMIFAQHFFMNRKKRIIR